MSLIADRAVAAATNGEDRRHAERWATPYRAGRLVRFGTMKIIAVNTDPDIPVERVAEIDAALANVMTEEKQ